MKDDAGKTRALAVSAVCVLSSIAAPTLAHAGDAAIRIAASDSYFCKMFPSMCGDEGTPGGVQNVPEPMPPGAPAAPMSREAAPPMEPSADSSAAPEPPPPPPNVAPGAKSTE